MMGRGRGSSNSPRILDNGENYGQWGVPAPRAPFPTPKVRSMGGGLKPPPSNLVKMLVLIIKVVVYPSYNDIHVFFLSEISSQRSRH